MVEKALNWIDILSRVNLPRYFSIKTSRRSPLEMGLPNKNYWEEAENNIGISSIVLILYELNG